MWNSPDNSSSSFTQELRLIIKRSKINVSIILKESDETSKYDLFQRLNTGGTDLSPQEVRNCILVMLNKEFYTWLKSLASYPAFQECISLSDRPIQESYDLELALRFLIFSCIDENELDQLGDVGIFITEKMRIIATNESFDRTQWEQLFKETFDLLQGSLSEESFKRYSTEKTKFTGGFLLSQYEVVAYGIGYNLNAGNSITNIREKAKNIWSNNR